MKQVEGRTDREIVVVGWDGGTQPMLRYRDELALPDYERSIVSREDREAYEQRGADERCRHCGELHDVVPDDLCEAARREYDAVDVLLSDVEEAGSFDERHTCAHHGVLDCETCRERELEARGT